MVICIYNLIYNMNNQEEKLQQQLFNANKYLLHHNQGDSITDNYTASQQFSKGLDAQQKLWEEHRIMTFLRTPVRFKNND